jgi:hypothetical protein
MPLIDINPLIHKNSPQVVTQVKANAIRMKLALFDKIRNRNEVIE